MKLFIAFSISLLLLTTSAFAQDDYGYSSSYSSSSGESSAALTVGFWEGGTVLGGEYEHQSNSNHGLVGALRLYSKDDDRGADGLTVIGGMVRPHFKKRPWDLFVSPGIAIIMIDETDDSLDDETAFGGILQLGVTYDFSRTVSIGAIHTKLWAWFAEDYHRGGLADEMSLMIKFEF